MGAESLNRSSANHHVHLGNKNTETLLGNSCCCMARSATHMAASGRVLSVGAEPALEGHAEDPRS